MLNPFFGEATLELDGGVKMVVRGPKKEPQEGL